MSRSRFSKPPLTAESCRRGSEISAEGAKPVAERKLSSSATLPRRAARSCFSSRLKPVLEGGSRPAWRIDAGRHGLFLRQEQGRKIFRPLYYEIGMD